MLQAIGTASDTIRFDEYIPGNRWGGIRLKYASDLCRVGYCHLEHGLAGGGEADQMGGGIYIKSCDPIISHCVIDSCVSDLSNYLSKGGGVYCDSANPVIQNCTISGNSSGGYGGGIYCQWGSPTITDCAISGNFSNYGPGIYSGSSNPTIRNCRFIGNSGTYGSGIYCEGSSATIDSCTITGNYAGGAGGALALVTQTTQLLIALSVGILPILAEAGAS